MHLEYYTSEADGAGLFAVTRRRRFISPTVRERFKMRGSEIVHCLTICLAVTMPPLSTVVPASAQAAMIAAPAQSAAIDAARANRLLLAIAAREEKCRDKDPFLEAADNEACSSRAMDAANALVPRAGTQKRFAALMRDLFEPMVLTMSNGDTGEMHEVTALYGEADLAQRRAAILTGATAAERAIERTDTEDMGTRRQSGSTRQSRRGCSTGWTGISSSSNRRRRISTPAGWHYADKPFATPIAPPIPSRTARCGDA